MCLQNTTVMIACGTTACHSRAEQLIEQLSFQSQCLGVHLSLGVQDLCLCLPAYTALSPLQALFGLVEATAGHIAASSHCTA